jgi:hypothetical protein
MFYRAFPKQVDREQNFYFVEPYTYSRRPGELDYLSKMSAKLDMECLTYLCIEGLVLGFGDLMTLTDIPTLSGLAIAPRTAPSGENLTDRHMRNWGRAVREKQTFQKLRILIFYDLGPSPSDILRAVSGFPFLHLVCITHPDNHTAELQGRWQHVNKTREGEKLPPTWADEATDNPTLVQIFDISRAMSQLPHRKDTGETSLFLDYRTAPIGYRKVSTQSIQYYVRLPDRKVPLGKDGLVSGRSSEYSDRGTPSKKRKVRDGKQKDLGSLLGGFN